jgi:ankyrin repeat protein
MMALPLHVAAEAGDWASIQRHLRAGVDVNAQDAGGASPLLLAVFKGHDRIVKLLLQHHGDAR